MGVTFSGVVIFLRNKDGILGWGSGAGVSLSGEGPA